MKKLKTKFKPLRDHYTLCKEWNPINFDLFIYLLQGHSLQEHIWRVYTLPPAFQNYPKEINHSVTSKNT